MTEEVRSTGRFKEKGMGANRELRGYWVGGLDCSSTEYILSKAPGRQTSETIFAPYSWRSSE